MAAKGKQQWDFLKADANTPASPAHYYEPLNAKKEGEFKPGWNTKRRGPAWEAERQAAIMTKVGWRRVCGPAVTRRRRV